MSLWKWIFEWLSLRLHRGAEYYRLDETLQVKLVQLARQEGRRESDLIDEMIATGLQQRSDETRLQKYWHSLSAREQDVTALVCFGYTNRQIAAHLGISAETVKTHLSSTLFKLHLSNRRQLRYLFSSWDFSAWQG